jgi:hypothetical protein
MRGGFIGARNRRVGEVRGRPRWRWTGDGVRFEEGWVARHKGSGAVHGWRRQVAWPAMEARVLRKETRVRWRWGS